MTDVMMPTVADEAMDFTVMALDPTQMVGAQRSLILWSARKIQAEKELLKDAEHQLAVATQNKWQTSAWKRRVALSTGKVEFYRKIKMALEAGYYIVPPFPLDIFAIRVKRETPKRQESSWRGRPQIQKAEILPAETGQYVSDRPKTESYQYDDTDHAGKVVVKTSYFASQHQPVDFPFKLARPEVMTATAKAMALRIFDRIGILPNERRVADPLVCGQILDPHHSTYADKPVTFFIAWWLDTNTL